MSMIKSQKLRDFQIINVDSGSTDGTWEIVQKMNPEGIVYQIDPGSYIPGKVLNDAILRSSGKIIVFNNSDCIPQNDVWLENLIKPLENENCAAVFGNQLPRSDAQPLVRKDSLRAYGDGSVSSKWHHFFSLATSAVTRKMITDHPFDPQITYSEDVQWSYKMKKSGYLIQYVPDAVVEHSHNYDLKEVYKRFHGEGVAEAKIYGFKPSILRQFIKPFILESIRDIVYLVKSFRILHIPYGVVYRFIQKYSVYKGVKDYTEKGSER
jgi:rhamnosyltransferase